MLELENLGFVEVSRHTIGVYALCFGRRVIYIGQSMNVYNRIRAHRGRRQPQWDKVFVLWCEPADLSHLEGEMIRRFIPKHNRHIPKVGLQEVPSFDLLGALNITQASELPRPSIERRRG